MKERLLGAEHPDTALTLHNYAALLAQVGRGAEARDLESRALATWEATLEPGHLRREAAQQLWDSLNP